MPLLYHQGLANGQRLRLCSDTARLWFPCLFCQANGFGRIEIDYAKMILTYGMESPPTEARFAKMIAEYQQHYLLFLYTHEESSTTWGEWWAKENSFHANKSKTDLASPAPPAAAIEAWKAAYNKSKSAAATRAYGSLPAASKSQQPGAGADPGLIAAVLDACREHFPATDEAMARQIVMVGLAARPGWKQQDVLIPMRLAKQSWRQQQSAAGFLRTLPAVLKTLDKREAQMGLFPALPPEAPIDSGLSEEEIAHLDAQRLRLRLGSGA